MRAIHSRKFKAVFLLLIASSLMATVQGAEPAVQTGRYVFCPDRSTLVQTGGFAGVHWTYAIEGQFCLIVDSETGSARFEQVDANAIDVSEPLRTLDPNDAFNLTGLVGTIVDDRTIEFSSQAANETDVRLKLTFENDTVHLTGETIPPPNSADFFLLSLDATAKRKYAGGTGDLNTPYRIATAEQMNQIGLHEEDWDKHFQLTADIDLSQYNGKEGWPTFNMIAPDIDPNERDFQGIPFTGIFDGNDHTIANFHWSGSNVGHVGLFGYVSDPNAEIRNLGLTDPNIDVSEGFRVGALVGYVTQGVIRNCFVQGGSVFGSVAVGGLVGQVGFAGEITDCRAATDVSGGGSTGGLVGSNAATIANCHADSHVVANRYVGGLVGDNSANIQGCYTTGHVNGDLYVGGLVGFNWIYWGREAGSGERVAIVTGTISDCHATGSVSGNEGTGGLVGRIWDGSATQSYATGLVTGNYDVGGLVGLNGGDVISCYATASIAGGDCAGGLIGENWENVTDCYATGTVSGNWSVGGLVGVSAGGITNCYAIGVVFGELRVGGLVGSADCVSDAIIGSFWDIETSGQDTSAAGTGLTMVEMQTAGTFLEAGWDFVDETANGTEDIWWILEGQDHPRLWWETSEEDQRANIKDQNGGIAAKRRCVRANDYSPLP